MKITADRSSFQKVPHRPYGTINLTINGETRPVRAIVPSVGPERFVVYGIAVRIGGGKKVWEARAILWNDKTEINIEECIGVGAFGVAVVNRRFPRGSRVHVVGFYSDGLQKS